MVLLRLWQNGLLAARWQTGLGPQVIEAAMRGLNETYLRVFEFLIERSIDVQLRAFLTHVIYSVRSLRCDSEEEVSLSLDIASYSDCKDFFKYSREHEPQARLHF
jgi:hypothetical protein